MNEKYFFNTNIINQYKQRHTRFQHMKCPTFLDSRVILNILHISTVPPICLLLSILTLFHPLPILRHFEDFLSYLAIHPNRQWFDPFFFPIRRYYHLYWYRACYQMCYYQLVLSHLVHNFCHQIVGHDNQLIE